MFDLIWFCSEMCIHFAKWSLEIRLINWYYLFNNGHVLQLRSETVAVRRRMDLILDYDGQMIFGDECGLLFPHTPSSVSFYRLLVVGGISWHLSYSWRKAPGKTSTRKSTRSGMEPELAGSEATMLSLVHSGGQRYHWNNAQAMLNKQFIPFLFI